MKIVFVIKTLDISGGAERVLTQVTGALADRGYEVNLIGFGAVGERDFYPVHPRVRRIWLNTGDVQARSSALDVWRRIVALRRTLRALAPDVAVGFMHSAYVPLAFASLGTGVPVVGSEHTIIGHFSSRWVDLVLVRVAAQLICRTVVPAEQVRASFPKAIARRMVVIPNPVATAADNHRETAATRTVLAVGRLSPEKRHALLIDAFARVAPLHRDWRLRIIGDGDVRPRLEAQVSKLKLESQIDMPGVSSTIQEEYEAADIFVMPSLYESFGLATAEALAAGVPAIGFAECPGTNELIRHDVNGLLVSGADPAAALAGALDRLMASADDRRRLGQAGPATVRSFGLACVVDRWEEVLRDVASGERIDSIRDPISSVN